MRHLKQFVCAAALMLAPSVALATAAQTQTAAAQATATANTVATQTANAIGSFTAVPTNTPSASTPTVAPIPTQAGSLGVIPEPVRFGAWKFGTATIQFGTCTSTRATVNLTIPGVQIGDFVSFENPNDASGVLIDGVTVIANNTVTVYAICAASNQKVTAQYHIWDRTYTDPNKNLGDPGTIP